MTGSAGQRRVPLSFLESLEISLPPLVEQRQIDDVLDHAESRRAKRSTAIAELECLQESVFWEMFGSPTACGKCESVRISDICRVLGRKRLPKGSRYSTEPTPLRYIRVVDIRDGAVLSSGLRFIDGSIQSAISKYAMDGGDVIISIAGSIGLVAPIDDSLAGCNLTENAAKLVPKRPGQYRKEYLSAALEGAPVQAQIASHIGRVTIGKLALFRIEKLELPLPPITSQDSFVKRIEEIDSLKALQGKALAELDTLFASPQHRAFRGEF